MFGHCPGQPNGGGDVFDNYCPVAAMAGQLPHVGVVFINYCQWSLFIPERATRLSEASTDWFNFFIDLRCWLPLGI